MPHVTERSGDRVLRVLEQICWAVGVVALMCWAGTSLVNRTAARAEIDRFTAAYAQAQTQTQTPNLLPSGTPATPDFQLWSPGRIQAWRRAQSMPAPPPLGLLRVTRLHVEAAVLEGTDDATLNRGVGHIDGTAAPGSRGNVGIAGHRDGFFRALKDIVNGDAIELVTIAGPVDYRVTETWIVMPDDVWVLEPTPASAVTLVTCFPFHFVGSAPQRFVVRAVRVETTTGAVRNQ